MPIPTVMRQSHALVLLFATFVALLVPASASAAPAPSAQQKLTVNIGRYPSSIDPAKAGRESDLVVNNALFAPLYRSPGGAAGRLVPFLAAGLPKVTNGGRTYTITLRAARWSDGRAITAADVRTAYTRSRGSWMGGFLGQVRSVSAPSARTVRITLAAPVPWFDELLASSALTPVPTHVIRRHGIKWTLPKNIETSGPFTLDSTRGAFELVLVKSPTFWGARAVRLQKLTLLAVPPASASTLFDAGRVDATTRDTSVLRSQFARRRKDPRFRTVASTAAQYLYLNTRVPELQQPAVRRGIALAIDRAALTQLTSSGVDQPLETIVPSGIRGSGAVAPAGNSLLAPAGTADAARARQELAAGGWQPATTFDLWFAWSSEAAAVAERIENDLEAAGVNVVLHPTTAAAFAKVGLGISPVRADVDGVLQGWMADYSDPQNFHQLFACASIEAGLNPSNHCSAAWDSGYDPATSTFTTIASRLALHRALEEQLTGPSGTMPVVPLYEAVGEYLVQKKVRGFVNHPSGRVDFEKAWIDAS